MSVIVEMTLPSEAFELGRVLRVEGLTRVTLETMVPMGGRPTPFFQINNGVRASFKRSVREHTAVEAIRRVNRSDTETLYALDWTPSPGTVFRRLMDMDVAVLNATGSAETWALELRFPDHETLSEFQEYYIDEGIDVTIERLYNPTKPDAGIWYGLTPAQRETLMYAVEKGYYRLPREISTQELADEFDISDQAVTERLRRGIGTLVSNTVLAVEDTSG